MFVSYMDPLLLGLAGLGLQCAKSLRVYVGTSAQFCNVYDADMGKMIETLFIENLVRFNFYNKPKHIYAGD